MDLFTPLVDQDALHPNFRALTDKHSAADRAVLEQWADGFRDRDGKFVREFQTTFNSSFWELYIFACCKELGFRVNLDFRSPDFVVDNFQNEFCIEAAIASNAIGESAEWERDLKKVQPNPEDVLDTAVIRLSNAIDTKHKKYLSAYHTLSHVENRPFVLAIAPFEQPYFWAHNDHAIRQVLYAYDRVGPTGEHLFRSSITKPSGASVDLGLFTSGKMAEISAILFSNTATISKLYALNQDEDALMFFTALQFNAHGSKPILQNFSKKDYRESLLDGLYVFHNPHAWHPLPFAYFNHEDITQGNLLFGDPVPRYKCKHQHLIQRSSMWIRPKGA
jgi:hypothetical protein